jgi:hypothetical protein
MTFESGRRIIFTGGWGSSEFKLPGVLEEQVYRICEHQNCGVRAHELWTARLDTGAWTEGYPEQYEEL